MLRKKRKRDGPTDRPTYRPTDQHSYYRDASQINYGASNNHFLLWHTTMPFQGQITYECPKGRVTRCRNF